MGVQKKNGRKNQNFDFFEKNEKFEDFQISDFLQDP